MTPLETLKAARQLISDPAKWTQGEFARDADGNEVKAWSEDATCFCAYGAIQHVTEREDSEADFVLWKACMSKFQTEVIVLNDTHTHAEVLALFDAAIAELEVES
jgi:hypothetical protein